jgi:hypothetical protein
MNKLLLIAFCVLAASCYSSNHPNDQGKDFCDSLRKEKINLEDMKVARAQMFQMLKCGFDSSDCQLAFPIAGTIIVKKQADITMGELMDTLRVLKTKR